MSVGASMLFALLSGYTRLLAPLDGLDIFAWRVVWTLPGALALLVLRRRWPQARVLLQRLRREPLTCLALLVVASLLGVQLWIFLWAPLHGRALEVSLGYFLLPLTMVLVGRFYYHERLDIFQWLAVACAVVGVLHELWMTRSFAWPTLVVALGYPPYFILRRKINADPVVAFALELALLLPLALAMLYARDSFVVIAHRPDMWLLWLPGLGLSRWRWVLIWAPAGCCRWPCSASLVMSSRCCWSVLRWSFSAKLWRRDNLRPISLSGARWH